MRSGAALALLLAANGQDFPLRLPAPGGEVFLPSPRAKAAHDKWHYAASRRIGNTLYLSGVIVTRRTGEGSDEAALRTQVRRAFDGMGDTLAAAGANYADVVKINSYHVWAGPDFSGSRDDQFRVFSEIIGEYIAAPYPAWTAIGTSGTLGDGGIAEIELIVYVPDDRA